MQRYDPLEAPDPKEWLELDEQERIVLVQDYHRRARIRLPNKKVHATLHAIVEAQIALGRFGEPSEIAAVVAFLASDEGHWVTGQTIEASGGYKL